MKHLISSIMFFCISVQLANATPIQWTEASGGNGHWYEFVLDDLCDWYTARNHAEQRIYQGVYGHLVTITSAAEQLFLQDNVMALDDRGGWLGGYQESGASEPNGGWSWVTGESWNYTHWKSGEPNNAAADEDVLMFYSESESYGWNDESPIERGGVPRNYPYIVEYAPEPTTMGLFAVGGLALLRRKR